MDCILKNQSEINEEKKHIMDLLANNIKLTQVKRILICYKVRRKEFEFHQPSSLEVLDVFGHLLFSVHR